MIITKETWSKLTGTEREWVLYNTMQDIDNRLRRLENKTWFNKALSFLGGVFGGIIGFFVGSKAIH